MKKDGNTIMIPKTALDFLDSMEQDHDDEQLMRKTCKEAAQRRGCRPTLIARKFHELFPRWSAKAIKYYIEFYQKQNSITDNIHK